MKDGWEIRELGDVSAINYGYTESASTEPVGPRFLRITDIQDDHVNWESVPYCRIERADLPKYRLASGDIVFARTGATTGKSFLVGEPPEAVFASYLIRLRLLDKRLLPEFVSLFFQSEDYWKSIKDGSTGSAQGGFNATKLAALSIPIPPLREQQRIIGILDEAFESITTAKANAEKNLQNARALFESYLQSVFTLRRDGWAASTLGEVCEFIGGSQPPKSVFSKTKKADNVRLIQIRDYKSDNHVVYIPRAQARRFCRADDVMIGRYGPPLFQILRGLEGAYNVALMKAVPDESKLSRDFLFYFLKHSAILQYVIYHSERAAGQIGLTKETLEPYPIALPSLPEQQKAVEKIMELEAGTQRLAGLYQKKLAALEALKKSLLHRAFTGEL
jgi:type I restriction enzyme, S subunit